MEEWDAVETARRIRTREVSADEVWRAAVARAEEASALGAIVTPTFERPAPRSGPFAGPFAGVPTFVKDLAPVEGVPIAWGSRGAKGLVAPKNDAFVERLFALGFGSLGKSAAPEFGMTAVTEPLGFDPCRNPWDPTRTPGGSSGGAAALVAAGVVPLAHASDGGGSIRIPAACCGLVGFKTSRGRMDMEGSGLLPINVAVNGCVSRTVRDTVAFHEALEASRPARAPRLDARPPKKGPLRVGLFVDAGRGPIDDQVREAVRDTGRLLEGMGHGVEEIPYPYPATVIDDFFYYWGFLSWAQVRLGRVLVHRGFDGRQIDPWTRGLIEHFVGNKRESLRALRRLRAVGAVHRSLMERYDALLSPVLGSVAVPLGHLAPDLPFAEHLQRLQRFAPCTAVINLAGAPAISLPLARSAKGMPIGVQIAMGVGEDRAVLDLAAELERARPWPQVAPRSQWMGR